MKYISKFINLLLILLLSLSIGSFAQSVPSGMKYQAVARDLKGEILANQKIALQISLQSGGQASTLVYYNETHEVTTSALGLFTLVIGEGKVTTGVFKDVPWSTQEIWMQVAIKDNGSANFSTISNSKLLAVPYAFHAVTASSLVNGTSKTADASTPGTFFNYNDNDDKSTDKCNSKNGIAMMKVLYLGPSNVQVKVYSDYPRKLLTTINNVKDGDVLTIDGRFTSDKELEKETHLVVVSPNIPVVEIPTKGDKSIIAQVYGNFTVLSMLVSSYRNSITEECTVCELQQEWKTGGNVTQDLCSKLGTQNKSDLIFITDNKDRFRITKTGDAFMKHSLVVDSNVTVKQNVSLNTLGGVTNIKGATVLQNTLGVNGATALNSTLSVAGATALNSTLGVTGATNLNSTLGVAGTTNLNSTLGVTGAANLNSTLGVAGATNLNNTLGVAGATNLNNTLGVTGATVLGNTLTVNNITTIADVTQSTQPTNGALVVAGGVGIARNLSVGGSSVFNGGTAFSGQTTILNATQSDNTTTGALIVTGGTAVGKNLNVGGVANIAGNVNVNNNKFNIDAASGNTSVAGTAKITGAVDLGNKLEVAGNVTVNTDKFTVLAASGNTSVAGTLAIAGATTMSNTVDVHGAMRLRNTLSADAEVDLNSTLNVDGKSRFRDSATFDKNLNINASLSSQSLKVSTNSSGYVATFENTNNGDGDGLKIKLGKTHPMWNGAWVKSPNYSADQFQTQIDVLKGWIVDGRKFEMSDLAALTPSSMLTGTVISIANKVTEKINDELDLPIYTRAVTMPAVVMPEVVMPAISMPRLDVPGFTLRTPDPLPNIDFPGVKIIDATQIFPRTTLIGQTTLVPQTTILPSFQIVPAIPQIPNPFPTHDLTLPNLERKNVVNSLTNENEFIRFVDKDERLLGAIRAQSINDFGADYFDGVYFVNVMASIVGIDILSGFMGAIAEFTNLIDGYNNIGVEYSSGHGDYAEWLPRENSEELISAGDIVGVKGGRITKDLKNAEQVMAVSYRPIMLGNAPTGEEADLGNKIAFLGQIPVKVIGAVKMGDFIVGKSDIPGYGVAVNPANITADELKLSVGRAWESSSSEGPKMINTLIGIQNGDYLNILKRSQDKIETMEVRLAAIEEIIKSTNKKNSRRK